MTTPLKGSFGLRPAHAHTVGLAERGNHLVSGYAFKRLFARSEASLSSMHISGAGQKPDPCCQSLCAGIVPLDVCKLRQRSRTLASRLRVQGK